MFEGAGTGFDELVWNGERHLEVGGGFDCQLLMKCLVGAVFESGFEGEGIAAWGEFYIDAGECKPCAVIGVREEEDVVSLPVAGDEERIVWE